MCVYVHIHKTIRICGILEILHYFLDKGNSYAKQQNGSKKSKVNCQTQAGFGSPEIIILLHFFHSKLDDGWIQRWMLYYIGFGHGAEIDYQHIPYMYINKIYYFNKNM
jgi:hypothetical protein